MAMTSVTSEAFHEAVYAGDVAIVSRFVAQPHVRARIAATEAFIVARRPRFPVFRDENGDKPWYVDTTRRLVSLAYGHGDVIAWLFEDEWMAAMSETVKRLLVLVAQCHSWSPHEIHLTESLLNSRTFLEGIPDHQKGDLLLSFAKNSCVSVECMKVVLAHGANVSHTIPTVAARGDAGMVRLIADQGALLVGASVLHDASVEANNDGAEALLAAGVDFGNGLGLHLTTAADQLNGELVDVYLKKGFTDVDSRIPKERTALMTLARLGIDEKYIESEYASWQIAVMLLECEADPELRDGHGLSAVDYSRCTEHCRLRFERVGNAWTVRERDQEDGMMW